jgi:hypothetical protein
MPIAMTIGAARWWNGAVIPAEIIRANAIAAISLIQIGCRSMSSAICCCIAGWWSPAISTAEFSSANARAAIGGIAVIGCAMTAAMICGIACRWGRAVVACPPFITEAYTSIRSISVARGMSIAMKVG